MSPIVTRRTRLKLAAQSLRRFLTPSGRARSVATRAMLAVWVLIFLSSIFINVLPHLSIGSLLAFSPVRRVGSGIFGLLIVSRSCRGNEAQLSHSPDSCAAAATIAVGADLGRDRAR
jgi:hypothetical protein